MNMIKVRCQTNIRSWKRYQWPTVLSVKPSIGEYITPYKEKVMAKIVNITHAEYNDEDVGYIRPILILELHTHDGMVPDSER